MPKKPKRPCRFPGCPELVPRGYCTKHADKRDSGSQRGYDSKWRKARDRFLKAHPLCVRCLENGKFISANVVDHIVPHRGSKELFWDESNWQSLCKRCHDKKTMTEDRYQEFRF